MSLMDTLEKADPELKKYLDAELNRQRCKLELIASENIVIQPSQAKGQKRHEGRRIALGHKVTRIKHERHRAGETPVERRMLAKLKTLWLFLIMTAITVEHIP